MKYDCRRRRPLQRRAKAVVDTQIEMYRFTTVTDGRFLRTGLDMAKLSKIGPGLHDAVYS